MSPATVTFKTDASPVNVDMRGLDGPVSPLRPDARPASSSCSWFFVMPAWNARLSWERPRSERRRRSV